VQSGCRKKGKTKTTCTVPTPQEENRGTEERKGEEGGGGEKVPRGNKGLSSSLLTEGKVGVRLKKRRDQGKTTKGEGKKGARRPADREKGRGRRTVRREGLHALELGGGERGRVVVSFFRGERPGWFVVSL